jgi:hypothetical protein
VVKVWLNYIVSDLSVIARYVGAYYHIGMKTISLKLPDRLLELLEQESRSRRTTKSSVVRECLEKQLPVRSALAGLPKLPRGESVCDSALPILKKAWARHGRGTRDLATNLKYMVINQRVCLAMAR